MWNSKNAFAISRRGPADEWDHVEDHTEAGVDVRMLRGDHSFSTARISTSQPGLITRPGYKLNILGKWEMRVGAMRGAGRRDGKTPRESQDDCFSLLCRLVIT